MLNSIWDLQRRGLGLDRMITSLAKEKLREGRTCMQKYLHKYFLREGHNGLINEVDIVFVDKTDPSDPTRGEEFGGPSLRF